MPRDREEGRGDEGCPGAGSHRHGDVCVWCLSARWGLRVDFVSGYSGTGCDLSGTARGRVSQKRCPSGLAESKGGQVLRGNVGSPVSDLGIPRVQGDEVHGIVNKMFKPSKDVRCYYFGVSSKNTVLKILVLILMILFFKD